MDNQQEGGDAPKDAGEGKAMPVIPPLAIGQLSAGGTGAAAPAASPAAPPAALPAAAPAAPPAAPPAKQLPPPPAAPPVSAASSAEAKPTEGEGKPAEAAKGEACQAPAEAKKPLPQSLLPLPPPQNRFASTKYPDITPSQAHEVIRDLESRLRSCEQFVGPRQPEVLPKTPAIAETASSDWYDEVRNRLVKTSLIQQVRKLHSLTDQLFHGRFADFEKKYETMKVWLEAENADMTSVILTQQAKRTYILEHEHQIRHTAEQLKTLSDLKEFINPPNLAELTTYRERLELFEARGHLIAEQVLQLSRRIQETAQTYNTAMNMLAFWLKEADGRLNNARTQGAQIKKREKQKTRVVFAMAEEEELFDDD